MHESWLNLIATTICPCCLDLRANLESFVLALFWWTPCRLCKVLLARTISTEDAEVTVVRVTQAHLVWAIDLAIGSRLYQTHVFPVCARSVPKDQVQALSGGNVICAVANATKVHNTSSNNVLVRVSVASVLRRAVAATELQACALEDAAKADIESHVGIVVVHIQTEIFTLAVSYDEGMMIIPSQALTIWEK